MSRTTVIRLVYLANARLPTEKAHGFQISKMCQAFAQQGLDVLLLHPHRRQPDPSLRNRSIFDYYAVPRTFKVRALANLDVVMLESILPKTIYTILFIVHAFLWACHAVLVARRQEADFYYTRDSEIAFWLLCLGLPTAYEAHNIPKRGKLLLLQRITRHSALKLVTAVTGFIRERLVGMGVPREKVIVLPDAVDMAMFENLPTKLECRRRLGLPMDRVIVGYIGRFQTMEMEKGVADLVRAMGYLSPVSGAEPLLLCVGGPMDVVPTYLEIAKQAGVPERRLRFVSRVPNSEVPFWIRACDVGTIPWPWTEFSAYFTSPMKLFEYMAAGVPIVATALPAIQEVLCHRRNSLLVEPGSAKMLAQAIREVVSDETLSASLVQNSQETVLRSTWNHRALRILEELEKTRTKVV